MLSPFIINDKNLHLDRYPLAQVNRSLQAWDAADEYLVNHIAQHQLIKPGTRVLIFNDLFGALTVNFTESQLFTVNDSFLSICGIKHNLEQNYLSDDNRSQLTSLDPLPDDIDVILYKNPKSKSLLSDQLLKIKQKYSDNVIFIAADRAKEIHTSTLKQFEKYLGTTKTSLAVKKARLVFAELDNPARYNSPFPTVWPLENTRFSLSNHANVYAREKLDLGARYFIQNLPEIPAGSRVIDLGCGNGVIGLTVLAAQEQAKVQFVDESHMAIASARENIENNLPQVMDNCIFHVNDCLTGFEGGSADVILCNPPFHQQTATTDHIAWQMFNDSFRVLKKGGELRIIGNRQLGYHVKLQRIFGNHKLIATNEKFVTISAIKK
ncbi:methyltransferase [Thalassomonas actiniarum]|uniref:Ribosomal RNA large subunit methyltransferase G n=1 Tax=Thalassomonas actiniarum TaxID=485447 RepID=A0AAE9YPK1_9GAMM|nr:methyltransferase [Thalassomonas actiniarum]WDD98143.1 methyltransferase [Thalassomonas actiniarum]